MQFRSFDVMFQNIQLPKAGDLNPYGVNGGQPIDKLDKAVNQWKRCYQVRFKGIRVGLVHQDRQSQVFKYSFNDHIVPNFRFRLLVLMKHDDLL